MFLKWRSVNKRAKLILSISVITGVLMTGTVAALLKGDSPKPQSRPQAVTLTAPPVQSNATPAVEEVKQSAGSTPQTTTTPTIAKPAAKTAAVQAATLTSSRNLVFSTTTLTARAGQSTATVTIRASDGSAINMPMGTGSTPGARIFNNFPAGPATASWTSSLQILNDSTPGTYEYRMMAQTQPPIREFVGSITVIVLPPPRLNVVVQALGYDKEDDTFDFKIIGQRLDGFSPYLSDMTINVTGLVCYTGRIEADSFGASCYPSDDNWPAGGTARATISTSGGSFSGETSFSVPTLI